MQSAVTLRLQSQRALQSVPNGAVSITGGTLQSITAVPDSGDQQFDVRFLATAPQVSGSLADSLSIAACKPYFPFPLFADWTKSASQHMLQSKRLGSNRVLTQMQYQASPSQSQSLR